MAAPGQDQRDFEFATKYGLDIPRVTAPLDGSQPPQDRAFTDHGVAANSGFINGMKTEDAIAAIGRYAQEHEIGKPTVNYRMRDWGISRQRYWGAPIPIVYCKKDGIVPVPDDQLPVRLPEMKNLCAVGNRTLSPRDGARVRQHDLPKVRRPGGARNRYARRLRLLVVVFPALRLAARR